MTAGGLSKSGRKKSAAKGMISPPFASFVYTSATM
jgi:hypothetical protein